LFYRSDLKPANIFVRHESHGINLKIGDFGLSKLIKSNLQGSSGCGNSRRAQHRIVFEEYDEDGKLYVVQPSEPSLSDPSSLLRRHHREPLTAGVGTASYSAPEQVSTRAYGSSADVFSLGLILLETLCCFSTEHERMLVFRDCRQKRKLPCELEELPVTAKTILACTESDPSKRPSAQELSLVDLRQAVVPSTESSDAQVQELVQQLREKDRELEQCKLELQEKQRAIETLVQEMERMKNSSPSSIFTYPRPTAISDTTPAQYSLEESSSSSRSSSDRL
jgi:serine/threonine protein kinase